VLKDWQHFPILLSLRQVIKGYGSDNIRGMIVDMRKECGGLNDADFQKKLICFSADRATLFQQAPFMLQMHCVAHRTNLAVQEIGKYFVVKALEKLCQNLNTYMCKSPKRVLYFKEIVESL
jgi:hypothetical protein